MLALKESLGFSGDEWTAIEPKIKVVQILASVSGTTGIPQPAGIKNRNNPLVPQCISKMRAAQQSLANVIADKSSSAELIRSALDAFRSARAEVRDQLTQTRQGLTSLLTPRQEAILVQRELLE
jgi:hypothetical protein